MIRFIIEINRCEIGYNFGVPCILYSEIWALRRYANHTATSLLYPEIVIKRSNIIRIYRQGQAVHQIEQLTRLGLVELSDCHPTD